MAHEEVDKLKGKFHQAQGDVQRKYGEMTGDQRHIEEGEERHLQGQMEETGGKIKDAAKDVGRTIRDALD